MVSLFCDKSSEQAKDLSHFKGNWTSLRNPMTFNQWTWITFSHLYCYNYSFFVRLKPFRKMKLLNSKSSNWVLPTNTGKVKNSEKEIIFGILSTSGWIIRISWLQETCIGIRILNSSNMTYNIPIKYLSCFIFFLN